MKVVLAETKYFKDSISIASELVTEVTFTATNDGLELVAMDPANVAMVVLKVLSSCFVEYSVKDKEELTINLSNFKQILRRAKSDDVLTLETTEEGKLNIRFKGKTTRNFSIPLLENEGNEQRVPDLQFPVTVKLPSSMLSDAIEDVSVVAESVTFIADKEQLHVTAKGDLSQAMIEIKADDSTIIECTGAEKYKAKYSLEYMKKIISGTKLSDKTTLRFNSDYPIKVEFAVLDKIAMSFILAPRVDNE